eukprot:TRINITY_DN123792_c0_g1_i1.p1 TRINITY_DN123792_c0_g1~~TRINITY_DN123792_c0_g1_i1.p1  ORF type:complete len:418 (-),score=144.01 TRINITY_DN123792_c0_g1_i1:137-1390(-)
MPKHKSQATMRHTPMVHSRCTQIYCPDVTKEALSFFSTKDENGEMPLVLIPTNRWGFSLILTIPDGVTCLVQKFGKDLEEAPKPGWHFMPSWYRIAYVVSHQSNTYNAPVQRCPTSDNVHVDIDCTLVFDIRDAHKFVYRLGAANFDELLRGTVDESIRALVRTQDVNSVYGLRGERADKMLNLLNEKFSESGVNFSDVKVTAVWLPHELASTLEKTTMKDKSMHCIRRKQEFELMQINQDTEMQIENITRKTEQALVTEAGNKRRAEMEFDRDMVQAEAEAIVRLLKAEEQSEVMIIESNSQLNRTKTQLETERVKKIALADSEGQETRLHGELLSEKKIMDGHIKEETMICDAEALKHEAAADKLATKSMAKKRQHELELREKEILSKLAASGQFNLVGSSADTIIQATMQGSFS